MARSIWIRPISVSTSLRRVCSIDSGGSGDMHASGFATEEATRPRQERGYEPALEPTRYVLSVYFFIAVVMNVPTLDVS